MHLIMAVEGLPEAQRRFAQELDRKYMGKGACRLRPIVFYDLQFHKEDLETVKANFSPAKTFKRKNTRGFTLKLPENPYKGGRVQAILSLVVRLFGWPFGFKPAERASKDPKVSVSLENLNIMPLAYIEDNTMVNHVHGNEEEYL